MTKDEALKLALNWIEGNGKYENGDKIALAIKETLANSLKPRCFADFQPNHEIDRKCQWCAVETECKTGIAQPDKYLFGVYGAEDLDKAWKSGYDNCKAQRTWVKLKWGDVPHDKVGNKDFMDGAKWASSQLKEKNNPLQPQEHNFCPRCGKRNKDIHTCTPPQD